jgi:ActR/RegA family two-component response regulator
VSPGSRIFVVDDEPIIASSLAAIMRMKGFSARIFSSPLEALAAARSESPDLERAYERRKIAGPQNGQAVTPSLGGGGGVLD